MQSFLGVSGNQGGLAPKCFVSVWDRSWRFIDAGNELGDMVHGQEHSFWFVPVPELRSEFSSVEGTRVVFRGILCNVSLLSVPATRI